MSDYYAWTQRPRRWVFVRQDTWPWTILEEGLYTLDAADARGEALKADGVMTREGYEEVLAHPEIYPRRLRAPAP